MPDFPFDILFLGSLAVFIASLVVIWWRIGVAVLRIGITGSKQPITVKLVSTSKAEAVFKALKG